MPFGRQDEEEQDDLFDSLAGLADRIGLKGRERSGFIDTGMTRAGYRRVQSRDMYQREQDEEDEQSGGGFFGRGGGRPRQQQSSSRRRDEEDDSF